jgi:hypothetical protein
MLYFVQEMVLVTVLFGATLVCWSPLIIGEPWARFADESSRDRVMAVPARGSPWVAAAPVLTQSVQR